jgi:hypothetical protein
MILHSGLNNPCPEEATLRLVAMGNSESELMETVLAHVETCPLCPERLDRIWSTYRLQTLPDTNQAKPGSAETGRITRTPDEGLQLMLAKAEAAELDLSFLPESPNLDCLGRLGDYDLMRVIGSGGVGIVFEGEHSHDGSRVAVKALKQGRAANRVVRERFLREAGANRSIAHPGIVSILTSGVTDGVPFFVMPLLRGQSFEALIARGETIPLGRVVEWIRQAATALYAAHQMGILHRDIKPSNLWLGQDASGNDQVYLLDFGLAVRGHDDIRLTASGIIVGTPAYISPEQLDDPDTVAPSGDLFSLGAVFYELLTLKPVFGGANPLAVFSARSAHKIIPPKELRAEIPKALNDLVMRLLAKDPKRRPASAQELVNLLVSKELLAHRLPGRRILLVGAAALAAGGLGLAVRLLVFRPKPLPVLESARKIMLEQAVAFGRLYPPNLPPGTLSIAWLTPRGAVNQKLASDALYRVLVGEAPNRSALCVGDRAMALADGSGRINLLNRLAGPGMDGPLWRLAEVTPAEWQPLDPSPLSGLGWDAERQIFLAASGRNIQSFRRVDNRFIASAWPESPAPVTSLVAVPAALSIGYQAAATLADGRILFLAERDKTENPGTPPHMVSLGDVGGDFRLAFSRNGRESITWSRYGRVNLWAPPDFARAGTRQHRQQLREIPFHEAETRKGGPVDPVDLAFGAAGEMVALFGRRDGFGLVFLYNIVSRRVEARLQVNDAIQIAVFGKDLWVLEKSGWLHLFENFEEQTRII